MIDQALATHAQLMAKIDAKFAEIASRHAASFRCGEGCHACCKPGLTVGPVEAAALGAFLRARPDVVASLRALEQSPPFSGARCSMLDATGRCSVYAARPAVCRSHGAPLHFKDPDGAADAPALRDVCPLNFTAEDVTQLPAGDLINLDTLNTILALLNSQYAATAGLEATSRTPLRVDELIAAAPPEA